MTSSFGRFPPDEPTSSSPPSEDGGHSSVDWTPEGSGWFFHPSTVDLHIDQHQERIHPTEESLRHHAKLFRGVGLTTVAGTSLLLLNACRQALFPRSSDTPSPPPPQRPSGQELPIISKSESTTVSPDEAVSPSFSATPRWTVTGSDDRQSFIESADANGATSPEPPALPSARRDRGFNQTFEEPVPPAEVPPPPTPLPPSADLPTPEPPQPPDLSALLVPPSETAPRSSMGVGQNPPPLAIQVPPGPTPDPVVNQNRTPNRPDTNGAIVPNPVLPDSARPSSTHPATSHSSPSNPLDDNRVPSGISPANPTLPDSATPGSDNDPPLEEAPFTLPPPPPVLPSLEDSDSPDRPPLTIPMEDAEPTLENQGRDAALNTDAEPDVQSSQSRLTPAPSLPTPIDVFPAESSEAESLTTDTFPHEPRPNESVSGPLRPDEPIPTESMPTESFSVEPLLVLPSAPPPGDSAPISRWNAPVPPAVSWHTSPSHLTFFDSAVGIRDADRVNPLPSLSDQGVSDSQPSDAQPSASGVESDTESEVESGAIPSPMAPERSQTPPEFSAPSSEPTVPEEPSVPDLPPPAIALPLRDEEQPTLPASPPNATPADSPPPDGPPPAVPSPSVLPTIQVERINVVGSTIYEADALSQIARTVALNPAAFTTDEAVPELCRRVLGNGETPNTDTQEQSDTTVDADVDAEPLPLPLNTDTDTVAITPPDLIQASDAITRCYTSDGYVNSGAFIPPEQFEALSNAPSDTASSVTIQVVEGSIEAINVEISRRDTFLNAPLRPGYVRRRLASVSDAPFNINDLVEAVQLLELDPVIERISTQIVPGTRLGTSVLNVEAEQTNSFSVDLGSNNDRSPSVGTFQQEVDVGLANLLGRGDRLQIGYRHTSGSDGFDFSYSLPVTAQNSTVELTYGFSNSEVIEAPFDVLDIQSDFRYYELRYRHPIVRSPTEEFALSLTASHQETEGEFLEALTGTAEPFPSRGSDEEGETRLSVLRFSQDWTRRTPNQVFSVFSEFSLGLDALNATMNETRPDGRFFSWKSQGQWVRRLAPDTVFLLRGGLQIADGPLVPLEQFGVGGQFTVRGYRANTVLADNGWVTSAEVRVPILRIPDVEGVLQVAPFVDAGGGWNSGNFDDPDPDTLLSAGLGVIWRMGDAFSARLDWGIPLTSPPEGGSSLQESGVHFSIQLLPL